MRRYSVALLILTAGLFSAGEICGQEVGAAAQTAGSRSGHVTSLDLELDFSFAYYNLIAEDVDETYSHLPMVGAGISLQAAPNLRAFFSVAYGQKSGNPYYDMPDFQTTEEATVKTLPFQVGLKYNLAQSTRVKLYWSLAFLMAWTSEELPGQLDYAGHVGPVTSSDLTTGYVFSFAPEFLLGQSGQSLGAEFGFGGTQGTLDAQNDGTHSHEINLTGFFARAYWSIRL